MSQEHVAATEREYLAYAESAITAAADSIQAVVESRKGTEDEIELAAAAIAALQIREKLRGFIGEGSDRG